MRRARVAGHLCVDLIPALTTPVPGPGALAEAGPIELRLGGCVANTGVALAALGAPVELVAVLGDDLLGNAVATLLKSSAVGSQRLQRISGLATSYSVVLQPPAQDRSFLHHVGTNAAFDGADVSVDHTDLLHVGYPQLLPRLLDNGGAGLADLLARARDAAVTTSVDFAAVDPEHARAHQWPALLRRWAPLIDVLTPSLDDLQPLYGSDRLAVADGWGTADLPAAPAAVRVSEELVRAGVAVALVTAGQAGMCLRTAGLERLHRGGRVLRDLAPAWANRQLWAPASRVEPVRTAGAGDTATAGLLYGLLTGLTAERALLLATSAAALHVAGVAPLPPWGADPAAYETVALNPMTIEGWISDPPGLLHGPVDQKGQT